MKGQTDGEYTLERRCEKYPHIPRTIVLKTELLNRGINYTPDLKRISEDGLPDTVRGFKCHHDVSDDIGFNSVAKKIPNKTGTRKEAVKRMTISTIARLATIRMGLRIEGSLIFLYCIINIMRKSEGFPHQYLPNALDLSIN